MYRQKLLRDTFRNRRKTYENLVPSGTRVRQFPVVEGIDSTERKRIEELCEKAGIEFKPFSIKFRNVNSAGELSYFLSSIGSDLAIDIIEAIVQNNQKSLDEVKSLISNNTEDHGSRDRVSIPELGINTGYRVSSYNSLFQGLDKASQSGVFDAEPQAAEPSIFGNEGEYNVVYLQHLNEVWKRNLIEKHIMENMRENKEEIEKPGVYIILDEAHEIIPQDPPPGSPKEITNKLAHEFDKMAREGRKYNINMLVSTHYPSDINDVVKKQCDTKAILGLSSSEARDAGVPKEYQEDVAQLNKGFGFINTKSSRTSPWTEVRLPLTNLNHMDIDPWETKMDEMQGETRDEANSDEVENIREEMG